METKRCSFYGFEIVRKELAATPKKKKIGGKWIRQILLENYDALVQNYSFENNSIIEGIAREYLINYRGGASKGLWSDFRIVACACFHDLDVLVSNDEATMLSDDAIRAYKRVNEAWQKLSMPNFVNTTKLARLV